ncbi:MAG: hypothetical protein JWL84_3403 [Rhodospirillales bacterium]|jgi:hypothetical protein|nr:hypothetical protein [Rhodospirillales bacterium]
MDRPDAAELIAIALARFREEILPVLPADRRLAALMIANALGIAERELAAGGDDGTIAAAFATLIGETADAVPAFVADLRRGRWDDDADLHHLLLQDAKARVAIANPR